MKVIEGEFGLGTLGAKIEGAATNYCSLGIDAPNHENLVDKDIE
jgi:hypothetical protein